MFTRDNKLTDLEQFIKWFKEADCIVVGIGSGMTNADGIGYSGKRFENNFGDFIKEFGFLDMLQASVYHFPTWPIYWAFQSRFMDLNYFSQPVGESFVNLRKILQNKDYFIITTNSDSSLETAEFDQDKIFYIQGKYNLLQCSRMCHNNRYQDDEAVKKMIQVQKDMEVSEEFIPKCPKCNAFLEVNKRFADKGMVEDERFFEEKARYEAFVEKSKSKKTIFWEIGVGYITPWLIKFPFWEFTKENKNSVYIPMTNKKYRIDKSILNQTLAIHDDINILLKEILKGV